MKCAEGTSRTQPPLFKRSALCIIARASTGGLISPSEATRKGQGCGSILTAGSVFPVAGMLVLR